MKKRYLSWLGGILWLLGWSCVALAAPAPEQIVLTWSEEPATTQTISWKMDTGAGLVQYGEAAARPAVAGALRTITAQAAVLATNLGEVKQFSATLRQLRPGVRYAYRVGDGINWSTWRTFRTAPYQSAKLKFLVFGDSQSLNYQVWGHTLQKAFQANPDAAFMVNMGDLVDVGQDYGQWKGWLEAGQGVIDSIPVVPVVGNHETYTPNRIYSRPQLFTSQLSLPGNGPAELRGQVYSLEYGDVHVAVLDSQMGEERAFVPYSLFLQQEWLKKDLAHSRKPWNIVLTHRPFYGNRKGGDAAFLRNAFVPILQEAKVDVVFTAHEHVYARSVPLDGKGNGFPGTIHVATGRSGTKTYPDPVRQVWNENFYNSLDEPNYLTVEVGHTMLLVKAFKASGALLDMWSLHKLRPAAGSYSVF
ncbi:MAG: metallophosphoesterase family protein [Anaeromusa sp.]|uniref:purple acid phosphatase family protein n=1 Tax=Anaeromusa sp. TaxID=1872520 RepID=UPI002B20F779|nr:metallophosphoesterase family protein [Anaeromusa sp.]MEA4835297.1 metallophosphoesterase family protein [Anaeromusa sp.]